MLPQASTTNYRFTPEMFEVAYFLGWGRGPFTIKQLICLHEIVRDANRKFESLPDTQTAGMRS